MSHDTVTVDGVQFDREALQDAVDGFETGKTTHPLQLVDDQADDDFVYILDKVETTMRTDDTGAYVFHKDDIEEALEEANEEPPEELEEFVKELQFVPEYTIVSSEGEGASDHDWVIAISGGKVMTPGIQLPDGYELSYLVEIHDYPTKFAPDYEQELSEYGIGLFVEET